MTPLSETAKATLKLLGTVLGVASGAAMTAITAAGQDSFAVFRERPSVWLAIIVAVAPVFVNAFSKGPQESRAIDAERQYRAEEKAFVKVATLTGNLPIPPDPRA